MDTVNSVPCINIYEGHMKTMKYLFITPIVAVGTGFENRYFNTDQIRENVKP